MARSSTAALRRELAAALPERPFGVAFWDGTSVPATQPGGPVFRLKSPLALAHVIRAPGELGLGRAFVLGLVDVEEMESGGVERALTLIDTYQAPRLSAGQIARLSAAVVRACGVPGWPARPSSELRLTGERHTPGRDRRAVSYHYDAGNDFFALFLDESMTYSCAYFEAGADSLEAAQRAKLELVGSKLGLSEGERVLDVGCGWGSFAIHAASTRGVRVLGVTLSEEQVRLGRERVRGGRPRGSGRAAAGRLSRGGGVRGTLRRDLVDRDGRARGRRADRPVRAHAARTAAPRGTAAQPRDREASRLRQRRRGSVLGAVRVPRRRPAAALADRRRWSAAGSSPVTSRDSR